MLPQASSSAVTSAGTHASFPAPAPAPAAWEGETPGGWTPAALGR